MKINLINEDQLQIILSKQDMFGKNMRKIFRDIIEQAETQFGFEVVKNTNLMVEAYPLSEESMVLTITKIKSENLDLKLIAMSDNVSIDPQTLFEFNNIEDLLELVDTLCEPITCESILYKYKGTFYLYIQDVNEIPEKLRGHFVEFGQISTLTKQYLEEHGDIFIESHAIDALKQV